MNSYDLYSSRLCYERPFCHSFLLNMWMKFCAVVIQIPEFKLYPWNFWQFCISESVPYGGPQLSRQNQKPHGKNKNLTAKPKTSRQKQIPTAKPKLFCCCSEVFDFAVRFLVLPWCFCFCREVFGFAVTVVGHHSTLLHSKDFSCEKKFKFSSDLFGDYWRSGRQNSNKTFIPSLPNKFCGIKENNISFS